MSNISAEDLPSDETIREGVAALEKSVAKALRSRTLVMTRREVRFLVDAYYQIQESRKALGNQIASLADQEPTDIPAWFFGQFEVLERALVDVLDAWTDADPISVWAKSVDGIGPVIAAGLAAHIDPKILQCASQIWRFAGLDPTMRWLGRKAAQEAVDRVRESVKRAPDAIERLSHDTGFKVETLVKFAGIYGEGKVTWTSLRKAASRCPWNERLKVLCWKIGDSFVKLSNKPGFLYGGLYRARKGLEVQRSESGKFKEVAAQTLASKRFGPSDTRDAYEAGKLPPGRLDLRARRYAVKIFLAHYFEKCWRETHGTEPPAPYPIQHLGHVKWIRPE